MLAVRKKISESIKASLKEKGCDSEDGKKAAKTLTLYSTTHPAIIYSLIDKTILKQGGTITPLDVIDGKDKTAPAATPPAQQKPAQ
jgi:hypothetical protein